MNDFREASYILGIKIYPDRSKRIIGLSQFLYVDKVLRRFHMEQSKKSLLLVRHGLNFSKSMCPKTHDEIQQMSEISNAYATGILIYVIACTRHDIGYMSITRRYKSNP